MFYSIWSLFDVCQYVTLNLTFNTGYIKEGWGNRRAATNKRTTTKRICQQSQESMKHDTKVILINHHVTLYTQHSFTHTVLCFCLNACRLLAVTSVQSSCPVRVLSERRDQRSKQSHFQHTHTHSLSLRPTCSHPSLQHNASCVTKNTRGAILHVHNPHNALGTVLINQTSPVNRAFDGALLTLSSNEEKRWRGGPNLVYVTHSTRVYYYIKL